MLKIIPLYFDNPEFQRLDIPYPDTILSIQNGQGRLIVNAVTYELKAGFILTIHEKAVCFMCGDNLEYLLLEPSSLLIKPLTNELGTGDAVPLYQESVPKTQKGMAELDLLIEGNFKRERNTRFYAEVLGVSAKRLNIICRSLYGKNVPDLIKERILAEANLLLAEPDSRLKEITYLLGFSDQAHFSKFYKQLCGVKPSEFRKRQVKT